jgi:hypothetical protein
MSQVSAVRRSSQASRVQDPGLRGRRLGCGVVRRRTEAERLQGLTFKLEHAVARHLAAQAGGIKGLNQGRTVIAQGPGTVLELVG